MPTIKEQIELRYQLYDEDKKNKDADKEMEYMSGYYDFKDYFNVEDDNHTKCS